MNLKKYALKTLKQTSRTFYIPISGLPDGLLEKISNRITNEIEDVTWVTYVISSKPPATIEPQ